jgi:large subunit ribosomal protein L25
VKEGGILQHGLREIEVECLPHQIPGSIEVNVSALKINESLHVRDLQAPEGVKILTESDATVVTIQPPLSDAKLEAMLAAAPPAEGAEPELVKKPAKEGEAAPAEAKAEGKAEGKAAGKEAPKDAKAAPAPKK